MMEVKCQQCHKYIPADSKFSPNCGTTLMPSGSHAAPTQNKSRKTTQADSKITVCPYCSEPILKSAIKCKHCGEFLDASMRPAGTVRRGDKNKIVAALLALFLGGIGIHKFYLGQSGQGIVYLLFFWTGIPWIIAFFEGIALLVKDQAAFDRQYNY